MSPSGMYWRVEIAEAAAIDDSEGYVAYRNENVVLRYSTGSGPEFAETIVDRSTKPDEVADLILASMPGVQEHVPDSAYADWCARLMRLVMAQGGALPIAFADHYDTRQGWEVGWGSGAFIDAPPPLPR